MQSQSKPEDSNPLTENSILVLEDEPAHRELVEMMLESRGFTVFTAENLAKAATVLNSHEIDLVLCDLELKGDENGKTLLHELAPKSPKTIVVMMTGNPDPRTVIDCLREGAFDYLLKPFQMDGLLEVVHRCLKRRGEQLEAQRETAHRIELLARYASECPDPVMRVEREGSVSYANDFAKPMIDQWKAEFNQPLHPRLCHAVESACAAMTRKQVELKVSDCVFFLTVAPLKGESSAYLYGLDITDRVKAEKELIRLRDQAEWMANHDSLTELPNRKYFEQQMESAFEEAEQSGEKIALVFIDLDNFKDINDLYGHSVGDQALIFAASHLKAAQEDGNLGKEPIAGRWGGDEIVLLLRHLKDKDQAQVLCTNLQNTLHTRIEKELFFPLSSSMGAAFYPDDGTCPVDLLQRADNALYAAKAKGPNSIVCIGEDFFEVGLFPFDRATAANRLQNAIRDQKIEAYFQPIVDCRTRKVVGAEALARWKDDEAGWIPADAFIPMAEESGIINELGRQVTTKALGELNRWTEAGFELSISINVSLRQVTMPSFCSNMQKLTHEAGIPLNQVILEVTERELVVETEVFRELYDSGFRLSIDDFGSGYSSLSQILDMPAHELKIDRHLTQQARSERGSRVLETLVKLGQALNLEVVVEGIESESDAELVARMEVDRLQGYLFTTPLPPDEFLEMLRHWPSGSKIC